MEAEIRRRKIFLNLGRRVQRRVFVLRRLVRALWDRILACSLGKPARYRMLQLAAAPSPTLGAVDSGFSSATATPVILPHHEMDSDLVSLKISLLGDCQIGKTSFLVSIFRNTYLHFLLCYECSYNFLYSSILIIVIIFSFCVSEDEIYRE